MKSKEKNKFRDVPIFNNIKEVIYNSVKLYRDNIAFVTKIKKENKSVEYINHTYQNLQLLAEIDMNGRLLILVIYLEELFLFLLIKNYN